MQGDARAGIASRRTDLRLGVVLAVVIAMVLSTHNGHAFASGIGFVSDDFFVGFDESRWTVVDPVGDGTVSATGQGTSDAVIAMSVPADVSHDPWDDNQALRVMQPTTDGDVEVEVKFDSVPTAKYQMQGLLFEQDANNWLRFDVHSTGKKLRAFAGSTTDGTSSTELNRNISATGSVWLRVSRTGATWTFAWSDDGATYEVVGSFDHAITVGSIGPFAANHGPNPAFTALVDYAVDTASPIDPEDTTPPDDPPDDPPVDPDWWSADHGYRVPIEITPSDADVRDRTVLVDLDLTTALGGATLEADSFRVVEVDATGQVVDADVPFQFDPTTDFEATANPTGLLTLLLGGDTAVGTSRTLHAYVDDDTGVDHQPHTVTAQIGAPVDTVDEGGDSVEVTTPTGTWSYHTDGGGFSSLDDVDGNDWIGYSQAAGAAGSYRGIPNLVYPAGHFHPGATTATTQVVHEGPLRTRLESSTADGWQMQWDIVATHATATVLAAPADYWFLYEGTPGGVLDVTTDTMTRSDGTTQTLDATWKTDLPAPEWTYFTDPGLGRSLFLTSHDDDAAIDSYRPMLDVMTVFGFGRSANSSLLSGAGRQFSVGLASSADVESALDSARASIAVTVDGVPVDGPPPADLMPPLISDVAVAPDATTATVTWTTDEPADGVVDHGPDAGYGTTTTGATSATSHDVTLTGLQPDTTYHYQVSSSDPAGNTTTTADATFTTTPEDPPPAGGLVSDDFSGGLDGSTWTTVDPLGDSTVAAVGQGTADAVVELSVPAGTSHDPWGDNKSLRIVQDVADGDFTVEARFDSLPSAKYQGQGLLVEQDADNWLRFDTYHDGSNLYVFAASTTNGSSTARLSSPIQPSGSVWLQVARTGDDFTLDWSDDGVTFTPVGTFTQPITVNRIGPFASNHTPSPAFTAVVDYVFDADAPIVPEDPTGPDTTPPTISDVAVAPEATSATVTWTTDEPADGVVDHGPDAGYGTTTTGATSATSHDVTLTGLQPDTTYHYQVSSSDPAGNTTTTADATFTTTPEDPPPPATYTLTTATVGQGTIATDPAGPDHDAGTTVTVTAQPDPGWSFAGWSGDLTGTDNPATLTMDSPRSITATFTQDDPPPAGGLVSDDFSGGLDGSTWTTVDPLGDSTVAAVGQGTADAVVELSVPAGTSHDPWGDNKSLRIVQDVADGDFTVEARFDSLPSAKYQGQGLLVEQDADNWLRFDTYHDGSNLYVFAASTTNGSSTARLSSPIQPSGSVWLQVARTGDDFTLDWSDDGVTFTPVGTFTQPITVNRIGPFASNHTPSPAFTAVVDYVFDADAPIVPEDPTGPDTTPPTISDVAVAPEATSATVTWTTDEPADGVVDHGPDAGYGTTTTGATSATSHDVTLTGLQPDTTYHYQVSSSDPAGNTTTTADATFTTTPEDPPPPATYTLTTATVGQGTIATDPAGPDHDAGTTVTVTAQPDPGWSFAGWSGDLTGTDNPATLTMDSPRSITATFTQDDPPPAGGLVSDDFSGGLDGSTWTTVDPLGDSTVAAVGQGTADAVVELSVPAGTSHDPWGDNKSLRIVQDVADGDFTVEARFDSLPSAKYQGQGLLVEQDADNWLRFDTYHDGSNLYVFAASTTNGSSTARLSSPIQPSGSVWLQVARTGDDFTLDWSDDGVTFTPVGTFTQPITVNRIGPFASNHTPSPAFTAVVDYVFDADAPIVPEDPTGPDTTPPTISDVAVAPEATSATVTWTTDEPADGVVDHGPDAGYGTTTTGATSATSHDVTLTGLQPDTTYHYQVSSSDPAGNTTTTADATFTTTPEDPPPPATYTLTTATVGQGTIATDPAGPDHDAGTTVTVTAQPDPGWSFAGWSGDLTGTDNPATLTMDSPRSITATFTQDDPPATYTLTTATVGQGTIATDPAGPDHDAGTTVTVTAQPDPGWSFAGWSGDLTGTDNPATLTMDGPRSITATFTQDDPGAGPTIDVWLGDDQTFGNNGQPQEWVNVLGNVSDADGVSSLSYRLNGAASSPLNIGPDQARLEDPGDFNVDIGWNDLTIGPNAVEITATDGTGATSVRTVTVTRVSSTPPSLPTSIDWSIGSITDHAQVVDGDWFVDGGALRTQQVGFDRIVALGDLSWTDYEVTVPVTVHAIGPRSGAPGSGAALVGVAMRWDGHEQLGNEQPSGGYWTGATFAWHRWTSPEKWWVLGNDNFPRDNQADTMVLGTTYVMKVRVATGSSGTGDVTLKYWEQGTPEPADWMLSVTEDNGNASGSLALIAHHVDASFGTVTVTPIP